MTFKRLTYLALGLILFAAQAGAQNYISGYRGPQIDSSVTAFLSAIHDNSFRLGNYGNTESKVTAFVPFGQVSRLSFDFVSTSSPLSRQSDVGFFRFTKSDSLTSVRIYAADSSNQDRIILSNHGVVSADSGYLGKYLHLNPFSLSTPAFSKYKSSPFVFEDSASIVYVTNSVDKWYGAYGIGVDKRDSSDHLNAVGVSYALRGELKWAHGIDVTTNRDWYFWDDSLKGDVLRISPGARLTYGPAVGSPSGNSAQFTVASYGDNGAGLITTNDIEPMWLATRSNGAFGVRVQNITDGNAAGAQLTLGNSPYNTATLTQYGPSHATKANEVWLTTANNLTSPIVLGAYGNRTLAVSNDSIRVKGTAFFEKALYATGDFDLTGLGLFRNSLYVRNKAGSNWNYFAIRNTAGSDVVMDLYGIGNVNAGTLSLSSYADIAGLIGVRSTVSVLNKAANNWLTWANRNTSGSEAVIDLSNIGTIALPNSNTLTGNTGKVSFNADAEAVNLNATSEVRSAGNRVGYNLAAYASGTVYTLTATAGKVDFGTADPVLTMDKAGTYHLIGHAQVYCSGATFAANRTVTLKVRRTNNTAADVSNSSATLVTNTMTTQTLSLGWIPIDVVYTTANSTDALEMWGSIDVIPTSGSIQITAASLIAVRLY